MKSIGNIGTLLKSEKEKILLLLNKNMERYYKWLEFLHEPEQNTVTVFWEKNWKGIARPFNDKMSQDEMADRVLLELQSI